MNKPLFEKVLVANRGEIALRIMRTLRKMDIKTVAIYSEADTNSDHVQYADEAYYIGNSPATESYLSIKNIVSAIRVSGAQAVHPGYGFLAENSQFANILKREGITLIGPSAKVIKQMGDKIEAKKIAIDSGVSTVPGYMGVINNFEQAVGIAEEIGFPIIIKAAPTYMTAINGTIFSVTVAILFIPPRITIPTITAIITPKIIVFFSVFIPRVFKTILVAEVRALNSYPPPCLAVIDSTPERLLNVVSAIVEAFAV